MQAHLFQELPLNFFRPLSGSLAPVYSSVLLRLYELDFDGEPFEITQDTAVEQSALLIEQSEEFIRDSQAFRTRIQEDTLAAGESLDPETIQETSESDEREARRLARHVLKRLERCGWFDYEYREQRKGYVLNFRDYAARILHTLSQVASREAPLFEGLAQSIKAALSPQELNENPGVALYNAQEATRNLVREIKILSRNIHRYIDQALKKAKTSQELLELQLDIYQKKVVDSSYHRFKTTENIFRYRAFILKQLGLFESDPALFQRVKEWVETQGQGNPEDLIREWLELVRTQLGTIHILTEDLDRKNARYTATTLQRIGYLLNQDHLIENKLYGLLKAMGTPSLPFLPPLFAGYRVQTWDQYSLYRPPKEKAEMKVEQVELQPVSEAIRALALSKAKKAVELQFSKRKVYELARKLISSHGGKLSMTEAPLESCSDFTRLIFISYHGFDRRAPYLMEFQSEWKKRTIQKNAFHVRKVDLVWKGESTK